MAGCPGKALSEVFISRPQPEAGELAGMVEQLGLQAIVQPAFRFVSVDLAAGQAEALAAVKAASSPLLIFTSTRSVVHGLSQLPADILRAGRVAAIGPATASALGAAGVHVALEPGDGYTSEDFLEALASERLARSAPGGSAFIMAAPGGREKLQEGLQALGWKVNMMMVYRADPAEIDPASVDALLAASGLLSVWTSSNAMKSLAQRLPPAAWHRLCSGEWLVISERLGRVARAYSPGRIHLARGPGNQDILLSIRSLL